MRQFTIIVGYRASDRAIGANGTLPWKIPKDMAFFRRMTTHTDIASNKNAVIMGRATFESMNCQPLAGRINVVCTSMDMLDMPDVNLFFAKSLEEALEKCLKMLAIEKVFVIGGEQLYRYAIQHPLCEELIINEFSKCARANSFDLDAIKCDAFFPEVNEDEYELILDYNNIDSISEIRSNLQESEEGMFIKIRYKKYYRKTV